MNVYLDGTSLTIHKTDSGIPIAPIAYAGFWDMYGATIPMSYMWLFVRDGKVQLSTNDPRGNVFGYPVPGLVVELMAGVPTSDLKNEAVGIMCRLEHTRDLLGSVYLHRPTGEHYMVCFDGELMRLYSLKTGSRFNESELFESAGHEFVRVTTWSPKRGAK